MVPPFRSVTVISIRHRDSSRDFLRDFPGTMSSSLETPATSSKRPISVEELRLPKEKVSWRLRTFYGLGTSLIGSLTVKEDETTPIPPKKTPGLEYLVSFELFYFQELLKWTFCELFYRLVETRPEETQLYWQVPLHARDRHERASGREGAEERRKGLGASGRGLLLPSQEFKGNKLSGQSQSCSSVLKLNCCLFLAGAPIHWIRSERTEPALFESQERRGKSKPSFFSITTAYCNNLELPE